MIIAIPVLDPKALMGCLASIAHDLRRHVLIIDNSEYGVPDRVRPVVGDIYRPAPHTHPCAIRPLRNIGFARAMNVAADRLACDDADDVLLWVSTGMRFGPDGGHRLADHTAASRLGVYGLPAGLHAFGLRAEAFSIAGRWDENFYPAYYEDTDWLRRLHLAGHNMPTCDVGGVWRDGTGYDTLRILNPGRRSLNMEALGGYYADKWGGPPGEEQHTRPWGTKPLDWWPDATVDELIERYRLGQ